jgi:hypothetical protein
MVAFSKGSCLSESWGRPTTAEKVVVYLKVGGRPTTLERKLGLLLPESFFSIVFVGELGFLLTQNTNRGGLLSQS